MITNGPVRRPRLAYVVTHPVTADVLLRGQLAYMRDCGFDVTVVSSAGPELCRVREREGVRTLEVSMQRSGDVLRDAASLAHVTAALRSIRPDIVNAGTTKAGLLGMMAARALRVAVRIYLLRGLRLQTATGAMRVVLGLTERIASACAHDVVCVSQSLLRASVEGKYIQSYKALVVGAGSSNGVDTERYRADPQLWQEGQQRLVPHGIGPTEVVVGYVGRTTRDKGIEDLLEAFALVRREMPGVRLVLIGGDLGDQRASRELETRIRASGAVTLAKVEDLAPYYARMGVFAFPSRREGFPNAVAEAASAHVPTVGYRSTGVVDAVVDGQTGALVVQGDVAGLARHLAGYLRDPDLRRAHGSAARARVERLYAREQVWEAWARFYCERLRERGLPLPKALAQAT